MEEGPMNWSRYKECEMLLRAYFEPDFEDEVMQGVYWRAVWAVKKLAAELGFSLQAISPESRS